MKKSVLIYLIPIAVTGCKTPKIKEVSENPPNILLIVSEDHSPHLSCYGDTIIKTPHLDNIAKEGILFRNAYVTQSVCSPSRSSILTGLYTHQNGHLGLATHGHHLVGDIDNIYSMLKKVGYRTGMIGKLHVNPASSFPIDFHPITGGNFAKIGLHRYWEYADTFMKASNDPFFLMVNFPDAHWPLQDQIDGRPANPVTPDDVVSFPYINFDNQRIRSITANYYNCILRLDECIGELMQKLNKSGLKDNTLVIFLSDHGDQMARGKYNVYEAGVRVPFLVQWPGKIQAGIESDALVSAVDIVPTILDAVGFNIPENLAGKSLIPLFKNPEVAFREYLFVEQNSDNLANYFPRRAVRDKKYKLIYSLLEDRKNPQASEYINHPEHNKPEWFGCPTSDELKAAPYFVRRMYHSWLYPPKIQLYDLEDDPWELNDISSDPEYFHVKNELLNALYVWQKQTNDPLRFPEKLMALTAEHDTIARSNNRNWIYPQYLYNK